MTSIQYLAISEIIDSGKSSKNKEREKYWSINLDQIESHTGKVTSWDFLNINEIGPSTHFFEKGTVLYSKLRPYLNKVVLADRDGYATTELVPIRCNVKIALPEYVAYFLRSPKFLKFAENLVAGAKMPRMVMSEFWKYKIPIPSLTEQRRIAAILDKAEALRAKRREAIAKLDLLLQSVFLDIFGDPVSNPRKWPVKELGFLCDVRDGTHDSPKYVEKGFPLVTSKNLKSGRISLEDVSLISEEDFDNINKRSKVDLGDILMPMIGTIGNPVLVEINPDFAIKNIALIKFPENKIKNKYILQLLNSDYFKYVTENKNRGGTQKFLSLGDIRKIPIPVPVESCQQNFEEFYLKIQLMKKKMVLEVEKIEKLIASLHFQYF